MKKGRSCKQGSAFGKDISARKLRRLGGKDIADMIILLEGNASLASNQMRTMAVTETSSIATGIISQHGSLVCVALS